MVTVDIVGEEGVKGERVRGSQLTVITIKGFNPETNGTAIR